MTFSHIDNRVLHVNIIQILNTGVKVIMENYTIRTPQISHETIDGETVIINLDNGNYYSMDGIGADIWNLISEGASKIDIINVLDNNFTAERKVIESSLNSLIDQLIDEGLIKKTEEDKKNFDESGFELISDSSESYKEPVLNKYTDMQDLLLLDPIHEVDDDSGWPTPKDSENNS